MMRTNYLSKSILEQYVDFESSSKQLLDIMVTAFPLNLQRGSSDSIRFLKNV